MSKMALTQRSFMIGQPREEFLEAADLDLLDNSLRLGQNVRIKASRTIAQKLGSEWLGTQDAVASYFEIRPADGLTYVLEVSSDEIRVLDEDAAEVWSTSISAMSDAEREYLWVEPFGYQTIIGTANRLKILSYSVTSGTFSLGDFVFDAAPGAALAQPYWSFVTGISITPSARTGSITVTASAPLFSAAWVGMRIRYAREEILITAYTSTTVVTGTVVTQLPATYQLTVSTVSGFVVGDVVVGQTTNYQGLITGISGSNLTVLTLEYLDGPDISEKISSPSGTATVSLKSVVTSAATEVWDEPLISPVRGYPRSGAAAAGRLFFCDFASAPDVIVASSLRAITDITVGDEDDDGIARAIGDNRPRLQNVVNSGDVLILCDSGCYLISLRDGTALTPASFNPIKFDARGSSSARPAKVDDGVVFIEAGGSAIAACSLSGNIYLKWSVRTISTFHDQLFPAPKTLCGPPTNCDFEDKYLFVINHDGSLVAMSWVDGFDVEKVGFVPWTTEGSYISMTGAFGGYWAVTERTIADQDVPTEAFFVERLSEDAIMDCQISAATPPAEFADTTMHLAGDRWYAGTVVVEAGGVPNVDDYPDDAVAGFNFVSRVMPWPRRLIQHPKAGLLPCRAIRVAVSVLRTGPIQIRCNNLTQTYGGYAFGDDLSNPPPDRTQLYRASVIGRRQHPEIEIIKPYPSRFQILAITQEVSL